MPLVVLVRIVRLKDNFVLRAKFDPAKTFTIPNAVHSEKFTPDPSIRQKDIEKSGNPD